VRHNEKTDQLFVKTEMVDGREWPQMKSGCCSEAEQ